MAKTDPTLHYLSQRREDALRFDLLPDDVPANRRPVGRLAWCTNGFPESCSDEHFAGAIRRSALPGAQFYLDTCFVTGREVDDTLWAALLDRTIVITAETWDELSHWRRNPFVNYRFRDLLLEAFNVGHPGIRFEERRNADHRLELATRWYVALLAFRKQAFQLVEEKLRKELGRPPSENELATRVQSLVHDRGWQLATKGQKDASKPNFRTDEAVLVRAVISAISTGRETSILTRDRDFIEQFYKLLYLIDTHYRGHLIGEAYCRQPLNFIEGPFPEGSEYFETHFHSGRLLSLPNAANDRLVPEQSEFVMVHVYRFSPTPDNDSLQSLGFCAEREMLPMILAKGSTRGRSTNSLGLSNIHRCINPYHQDELGSLAAIAVDRCVEVDDVAIPWVDIELVMSRREQLRRIAIESRPDGGTYSDETQTALYWSHVRCDRRLSWMPCPEAFETTAPVLAKTIGFLPFHVRKYADSSFLTSNLHESIREVLKKTGYGTTELIHRELTGRQSHPPGSIAGTFRPNKGSKGLHLCGPDHLIEPYRAAYEQYLALLVFRKQFGAIVRSQVASALGAPPTDEEWLHEIRSFKGNHESRALDAQARVCDPAYYLEDQLLAFVVVNSILSGSDCVLLTNRRVVQQQFMSLVAQLDLHYRAWCLAEHDPEPPVARRVGSERAHPLEQVGFRGPVLIRGVSQPYAEKCLPNDALDLQLQCWFLEGDGERVRFEPVAYLAERTMHSMLNTRGVTGGLTTDLLGPEDLQFNWKCERGEIIGCVLRGESAWTEVGSVNFPKDDRIQIGVTRVPTKDLVSMVNFCDVSDTVWRM